MPDDAPRLSGEFAILAASARIDDRTRVLKHGDTFGVFDRFGDVEVFGPGELGLYHQDTRFLSRLTLRLATKRPVLLSSTINQDSLMLSVDLMNPDVWQGGELTIPRGTVHVFRSKVLWQATCHEWLRVYNYGRAAADVAIEIDLDADFADIFEVRGLQRPRRGRRLPTQIMKDALVLGYEGLDGRVRRTRFLFEPVPSRLSEREACFDLRLEPHAEVSYRWAVFCEDGAVSARGGHGTSAPRPARALRCQEVVEEAARAVSRTRAGDVQVVTSNEQFDEWLKRSLADLHMLRTETPHGPYPYAGVPWFSTAFGRDGIITALECLWANAEVARGVLTYLAATQADVEEALQDAQPGKVLHETRAGEMARLGEVPFGRYYGTVDATPLFVLLAGAYYERTGDRQFAQNLWPHVERALTWIDRYGDSDGDGFVEYARRSHRGLVHQGWKDSQDAIFHADGALAEPPIALCEVQGYVYAAKVTAAKLAAVLEREEHSHRLAAEAEALRSRFEERFWRDELSTYALALDGRKEPCCVRASNAGHCLFAGIASDDRAARLAGTLTDDASFSGWGIRTVAASEACYSPMSYHNGSVWPHDNALIAAGFARYGLKDETIKVLTALFDASRFCDLHRLPELFCGFHRRGSDGPTLYPVSCAPQAWAAGAVFLLLQACLGLEVCGSESKVIFNKPLLPAFLDKVRISHLRVGEGSLDLSLTRHPREVGVDILRREGQVSVVVVK
jgi:glycogen debranching enzyme